MKINPVNTTGFKGIWLKEESQKINDLCIKEKYVYRPFADESEEKAEREVNYYNDRLIEHSYNNTFPRYLAKVEAKMGEKLNITSEEYKKIRAPYGISHPFESIEILP